MSILNGKEREGRLIRGEEISYTDKEERRRISGQVKRLMNRGVEEGDAVVAAIENARGRKRLDSL